MNEGGIILLLILTMTSNINIPSARGRLRPSCFPPPSSSQYSIFYTLVCSSSSRNTGGEPCMTIPRNAHSPEFFFLFMGVGTARIYDLKVGTDPKLTRASLGILSKLHKSTIFHLKLIQLYRVQFSSPG